jgi:hypothetical protein
MVACKPGSAPGWGCWEIAEPSRLEQSHDEVVRDLHNDDVPLRR